MRGAIVLVSLFLVNCFFFNASAVAAEAKKDQVASTKKDVVAVKRATKVAKTDSTDAPVRVWTVEMSCCEPQ